MSRRLAFLTMEDLTGFVCDDELAVPALEARGWTVEMVPWRRSADWDRFDLVVIRSTWDYQKDPERFLETLRRITTGRARLENPLPLVEWNLRKSYLQDLAAQGVPVAPTFWATGIDGEILDRCYRRWRTGELVLKPIVGANADDTFRLPREQMEEFLPELREVYRDRVVLIQPFLEAVVAEGEYSLFYFGGRLSHVILKTPKQFDFRVQEEHGGLIRPVPRERVEESLLRHGERAMAALPRRPLYARVDLVRHGGGFVVMEFELIEPALYFRMDPGSPERFAAAVDELFAGR